MLCEVKKGGSGEGIWAKSRFSGSGPVNVHTFKKDEPRNWYGRKKRYGPGKESGKEKLVACRRNGLTELMRTKH